MDQNGLGVGRFHLDADRRQLLRDGTPVHLGSRAFDLLCVLAAANGKAVSKDELMTRVWPGVIVEENNIQVHISALRKAARRLRPAGRDHDVRHWRDRAKLA